jgi:hypothetical protein
METESCGCGFTATAGLELTDHFLEMFGPADARDATGQEHDETGRLACACGFETTTIGKLDAHFLAVFTPRDHTGLDGRKHVRVPAAAGGPEG